MAARMAAAPQGEPPAAKQPLGEHASERALGMRSAARQPHRMRGRKVYDTRTRFVERNYPSLGKLARQDGGQPRSVRERKPRFSRTVPERPTGCGAEGYIMKEAGL